MSDAPADRENVERSLSRSARSTALVMSITALSRVLGFVRQATVNAVFGASGTADVLNAVFNIPNNLRKLLAEGALSSAFIPVLSQASADAEAEEAGIPRQIVRNLLAFQYLVLVPVLVLSVIFAGPITRFILDFPEAGRQELAAELFRWFIHYTLLISVSAVLMGTLNSLTGATLGAALAFLAARHGMGDWVARRTGRRLEQLQAGIDREGWRFVALMRLVPLVPFKIGRAHV